MIGLLVMKNIGSVHNVEQRIHVISRKNIYYTHD